MIPTVLEESAHHKSCIELAADLVVECVPELQRFTCFEATLKFLRWQSGYVRIWQGPPNDQSSIRLKTIWVEKKRHRLREASHERSAGPQHPKALPPNRTDVRHKNVRTWVEYNVKRLVWKPRQIRHLTELEVQCQTLTFGHGSILRKLRGRVIQNGDNRAGRSKHGCLLAPRGCEGQEPATAQFTQPRSGDRLVWGEHHSPVASSRTGDDLAGNRNSPRVSLRHLPIPCEPVMPGYVDAHPSSTAKFPEKHQSEVLPTALLLHHHCVFHCG